MFEQLPIDKDPAYSGESEGRVDLSNQPERPTIEKDDPFFSLSAKEARYKAEMQSAEGIEDVAPARGPEAPLDLSNQPVREPVKQGDPLLTPQARWESYVSLANSTEGVEDIPKPDPTVVANYFSLGADWAADIRAKTKGEDQGQKEATFKTLGLLEDLQLGQTKFGLSAEVLTASLRERAKTLDWPDDFTATIQSQLESREKSRSERLTAVSEYYALDQAAQAEFQQSARWVDLLEGLMNSQRKNNAPLEELKSQLNQKADEFGISQGLRSAVQAGLEAHAVGQIQPVEVGDDQRKAA